MTGDEIEQYSPEWWAARLGKVTASQVEKVMTAGRGGAESKTRAAYMDALMIERLTGAAEPGFTNAAMQWGTDKEPEARAAYEFRADCDVRLVGIRDHPRIPMFAASPDGLVGEDGVFEAKCPNSSTHLETLQTGKIARGYMLQMQAQMACYGRAWCDFVSYDPRLPEWLNYTCIRVARDDALIGEIERAVESFLAELDAKITGIRAIYERKSA